MKTNAPRTSTPGSLGFTLPLWMYDQSGFYHDYFRNYSQSYSAVPGVISRGDAVSVPPGNDVLPAESAALPGSSAVSPAPALPESFLQPEPLMSYLPTPVVSAAPAAPADGMKLLGLVLLVTNVLG